MKANILKTNIIRIVLIFFVLVCLYFIISTGQILLKTDERLYDFAELKRLNEELYLQIDLQNIHTTIENTENSINEINTLMDKISSNCVSDCACAVAVSDSYESDIEADWQKQNVVYEKDSSDSFASIIWEVNYELSDMQRIHLVIDDNNKKVIGFGIWDDNIIDSMLENEEFIYLFARYLGQYYDVNFEIIHQNMQEDGMLCEYTCELTTNEGKCIQKKIVIKEDTFGFM